MTPRAMRAHARVLGLAFLLALASTDSRAGDLYRWVTPDGRVEIGTAPPAGTKAEPWNPGEEAIANPAPPAAAPPAPAPAETPTATAGPARGHVAAAKDRPRGRLEEACSTDKATADKATQKIRILEAQIARLEKRREELEATELAFSRTSCRSQDLGSFGSDCTTSSFHRDAEIARTEQEIEDAQQKLADLEQRLRSIPTRAECTPAAADAE